MPYTALHDRPPYFGNPPTPSAPRNPPTPRYVSPDIDPLAVQHRAMTEELGGSASHAETADNLHRNDGVLSNGSGQQRQQAAYIPRRTRESSSSSTDVPRKRPRQEEVVDRHAESGPLSSQRHQAIPYIHGSFFGMTARNPTTRIIGDFLMAHCRGRSDIEVEVKLGQISTPVEHGQRPRRITLPSLAELILPDDYRVGPFRADMTKAQHASLNHLLNEATANSDPAKFRPDPSDPSSRPPHRIKFFRARQIDTFYNSPGNSKTRVSRDAATGEVVACIKKRKVADLNVANHLEALDFRVSVSTEEPSPMPEGNSILVREKDRACYRHQLVQIDLTFVKQVNHGQPTETFEVEIEVIDVPGLIAEGLKEERGEPNQYDEMVTSILDSARILIRNIVR